ncbi:hypothetical protein [Lentibacillus salinarum]|uniref:MarR family transcriptional regulator n=1 Tax=Lentibacillus salinarum TaxID=446820 RepID=A0ABW3ZZ63_9BACI
MPKKPVKLNEVNEQEKNANDMGYGLYKIKDTNKAPFGQIISDNIETLRQHDYLTGSDKILLFDIEPLIEMNSNILVNKETGGFMTISDIGKYLGKNVSHTSTVVNRLINKGILFEMTNTQEIKQFGRSITQRPIFMNPEIIYKGNRNEINASLARLTMNLDPFERQKIHMPWKVWMALNAQSGKLYRRKTYLKYKKS